MPGTFDVVIQRNTQSLQSVVGVFQFAIDHPVTFYSGQFTGDPNTLKSTLTEVYGAVSNASTDLIAAMASGQNIKAAYQNLISALEGLRDYLAQLIFQFTGPINGIDVPALLTASVALLQAQILALQGTLLLIP